MSKTSCLAVLRVRGTINIKEDINDTLKMLRLNRANHLTILPSTPEYLGMIQKIKNYIIWGEITPETLTYLLKKRGEMIGGKKIAISYLEKKGFKTFEELANKILSSELKLKDLDEIKPIFRLHPPSKGFKKSLKHAFTDGGELGYRGEKINTLLMKMM